MVGKVVIDGKELSFVNDVKVSVETPADYRGVYQQATLLPVITITRRAIVDSIEPFKLITGNDGRTKLIEKAEITFKEHLDFADTFTFTMEHVFVTNYSLSNPTDGTPTETIELRCKKMKFDADGSAAVLDLTQDR